MVRGVGPGLPLPRADARRRGLRQAPAGPDAAGTTTCTPSGQIPAYEWNFGDVNPPVHAWATMFTFAIDKVKRGQGDVAWLEGAFQKLLLNFTWWVNRKDRMGSNLFEGGFLGLDNIGVFDRSAPLPTGGYLEQADGTAWMALFCQNMLEIAGQLALERRAYADLGLKFVEHFLWIGMSMKRAGGARRDVGRGRRVLLRRSPDAGRAASVGEGAVHGRAAAAVRENHRDEERARDEGARELTERAAIDARPELSAFTRPTKRGQSERRLGALLNEAKLRRMLEKMLDEREFLSPYGIRALSRYHAEHPYVFHVGDQEYRVEYLPAESDTGMFGGNSNWRGPIWMPVNGLIIRALLQYHTYYGDTFTVECPTGSGRRMTLYEVAEEITRRLASIFLRNEHGRRPVYGGAKKFQEDPHWRDLILFYEYFHGDNGAGPRREPPDRLDRHRRPRHASLRDQHLRGVPEARQARRRHRGGADADHPSRRRDSSGEKALR